MPKSKVRKKPATTSRTTTGGGGGGAVARGLTPSPTWYPIVMASVLLLGLAYMVVYYLTSSGTSPHVPIMATLGAWNFAIGFGVMLLGLVMAVRWR